MRIAWRERAPIIRIKHVHIPQSCVATAQLPPTGTISHMWGSPDLLWTSLTDSSKGYLIRGSLYFKVICTVQCAPLFPTALTCWFLHNLVSTAQVRPHSFSQAFPTLSAITGCWRPSSKCNWWFSQQSLCGFIFIILGFMRVCLFLYFHLYVINFEISSRSSCQFVDVSLKSSNLTLFGLFMSKLNTIDNDYAQSMKKMVWNC